MENKTQNELMEQLIEQGRQFILPEKIDHWINYVKSTNGNIDSLHNVFVALGIIASLDNGEDMNLIIESFEQKECPFSVIAVRSLVANYSIRGPEFFEKTAKGTIPEGNLIYLEKLKRENARILFVHSMRDAGYDVQHSENGSILVNCNFDSLLDDKQTLKREKASE